jgi:hypothetical protein
VFVEGVAVHHSEGLDRIDAELSLPQPDDRTQILMRVVDSPIFSATKSLALDPSIGEWARKMSAWNLREWG